MPVQASQWTEFLSCAICYNEFDTNLRRPISLGCSHTMCKSCLSKLQRKQCPFDQTLIKCDINLLPENYALLQLVGGSIPPPNILPLVAKEDLQDYLDARKCIEDLALYLKVTNAPNQNSPLSKPLQRRLVTLINCQLVEEEGRTRGMRAVRSIGERSVTELILQHQNPQKLSANLWAAVRARGCQFLGPAMQEKVLGLVLLALEDGSALSRKVLVMFVVQRLLPHFPQASKTSIGHVVQLLYRASCFKVSKQEGDSSLMQLKEEFRAYEALRREHDAQIVQIATEAGLRIAPEQWSLLLYGDAAHKSHMQSIIDKLQTPQSFAQSVQELVIALQRTGDPGNLSVLRPHLELLAGIDPTSDAPSPSWKEVKYAQEAARSVVKGLVEFVQNFGNRKQDNRQNLNVKFKTSMNLVSTATCNNLTESDASFPTMENNKAVHQAIPFSKASTSTTSQLSGPVSSYLHCSNNQIGCRGVLPSSTAASYQLLPQNRLPTSHDSPPFQPLNLSLHTLPELQRRKKEVIAQLEKARNKMFNATLDKDALPTAEVDKLACLQKMISKGNESSFYSPWTSTSLFSSGQSLTNSCNSSTSVGTQSLTSTFPEDLTTEDLFKFESAYNSLFCPSEKDEFIPFDQPLVPKFGPISRCPKNLIRGNVPIQVNSVCQPGELTSPTSAVIHPLLSASFAPAVHTATPPTGIHPTSEHGLPLDSISTASTSSPINYDIHSTSSMSQCSENLLPNSAELTNFLGVHSINNFQFLPSGHDDISEHLMQTTLQGAACAPVGDHNFINDDYIPVCELGAQGSISTIPTSIGPWPTLTLENRSHESLQINYDIVDEMPELEQQWLRVLERDDDDESQNRDSFARTEDAAFELGCFEKRQAEQELEKLKKFPW